MSKVYEYIKEHPDTEAGRIKKKFENCDEVLAWLLKNRYISKRTEVVEGDKNKYRNMISLALDKDTALSACEPKNSFGVRSEKQKDIIRLLCRYEPLSDKDIYGRTSTSAAQLEALLKKGIVTLWEIPTVKEQYGSQFSNADKISLWQGDITRLKVDAVVNAANSQMLGCFVPCHGCIDNAIHSAAGIQLRTECNHIMNQRRIRYGEQYEEPTGTATLTKAYNLPCKYVIHTVGPIVYGELNEELRQELRNCYENVLKCCVENEIKSVAFCCISTGEFHFPNDEAAEIALNTVTDFLKMNDGMERVIFNVFKDSDKEIYQKIFGSN